MKKKSGGGASFDRRHVRPKHVVMGRAVQAQETRAGQKRSAAQDSRDASLGFDLRRRARLSANVLVDHRTARTTPTAARRARAAQSDEERMLAQWHRERQRSRKYSLGEGDGAAEAEDVLTHSGRVLGAREEDYHEMPEGLESDAEEDVLGHNAEDLSALYEGGGASVVERARARRAERQRERAERQRLAASLDDQFDAVAALVLEHKRARGAKKPELLPGTGAAAAAESEAVPTLFTETGGDEEDKEEDTQKKKKEQQKKKEQKGKGKGKGKGSSGDDDDDDFEALVLALGSEAKGRATDRTKRPEELAAERVAQLEALEAERVRRQAQTALGGGVRGSGVGGDDDDDGNYGNGDDNDEDDEDDDGGLGLAEMRRLLREQNRISAEADDVSALAGAGAGQEQKEQHQGELPFTFGVPGSVAEWAAMSAAWGARERELVVRRILACNHPSLAADNAARLTAFVGVLLDSVGAAPGPVAPRTADSVARSVVFLARELGGEAAARAFAPRLRACYAHAVVGRAPPAPGTLCVLKIAQDVFPISDFRHVVATPLALLLAALVSRATLQIQQLQQEKQQEQQQEKEEKEEKEEEANCEIEMRRRVETGLYVCTLLLQYAVENARYIPEALAFLGVLLRALGTEGGALPAPQGPCVPLALPWTPAGAADTTALEPGAWAARVAATALRLLGVAARAWVPMAADAVLALHPLAQHVAQHLAPRLDACPGGTALVQQTLALCTGEQAQQQQQKGQQQEQRTFRTVERRNALPIRELAPRIAEASLDQRQVEQERLRRLKRTLARERKALGREVKKDAAYTLRVLEQESADENRAIRAAHGRILNMLQDEQHEQKVEQRQKEREKRRLRM